MSSSNCCFLTCIQISQESGKVAWCSHLLKNFPQSVVIHTVKGFSIVNKAEVDVFLELSCFLCDATDVGILISGSSAFCKTSLNSWKFMVHILLKTGLENFEHYFTCVWDECNCVVVWAFFGIACLWEFSTVYCDPHNQRLGIVNKAEIDVFFLELFCFFSDPVDVGNLIYSSSAF